METKAQADQLIAEVPRLALAERHVHHGTGTPKDAELVPRVGYPLSLDPCVSALELASIERATGRPCPRVDLDRRNSDALALTFLSINDDPLCGGYYEAAAADWPPAERVRILRRVFATKANKEVQSILHPKPTPQKKGRA